MDLKIIYDNRAEKGFLASWGFSCLIEAEEKILFDVGWDPHILLHNLQQFKINLADIQRIVHSFSQLDILKDAFMVCPCHCTQHTKDIEKLYRDKVRTCRAGCILDLGD